MKEYLLSFGLMSLLAGCGVSEREYNNALLKCDSLTTVVDSLMCEIDELQNGEHRLINLAMNSFNDSKFILANEYIEKLKAKHPESKELPVLKELQQKMAPQLLAERTAIEKRIKDSIRLANIDNLGVWTIGNYVDDFGEKTDEQYVATELFGTFSNSATTNSDLRVRFLIDKDDIRIQLYEYARNHPIKGEDEVTFKVRDSHNNEYTIRAWNSAHGDTTINKGANNLGTLRRLLLAGGELKFVAIAGSYSRSEYKFTLTNADYFENALLKAGIEF